MSSAKTIAKNTTVFFVANVVSRVLSFFLIVFITRYLGDIGLGKYSFVFAFVGFLGIFSDFGVSTLLTKDIARDKTKTKEYFENIASLKLIFSLLSLILPIVIIYFIKESPDVKIAVYIVAVAMFFYNYNSIFGALFQAYEKMEYVSIIIVMERIITAGLSIFLLMNGFKLIALTLVFLFSYLIVFAAYLIFTTRKITKIRFRFDTGLWKKIMMNSMPFWFTVLFITIYFRIDTIMLAFMKGYETVGWYSASYKALDALYFIPAAVIMAVFPVMSRLYTENKQLLLELYKKTYYCLLSLGIPIGIGTTLLAERIIIFIYKDEFINSVLVLQILIWAEVFIFLSSVSGYLLNSIDKQKVFSYITGVCAVLNIILNFMLIPHFSYIGASVATVITEFFVLALLLYFVSKNGYKIEFLRLAIKPVIAGAGMGLVVVLLNSLHLLLLIPVAAIAYFGLLFLIKGMGKEYIELVKGLVKRTK